MRRLAARTCDICGDGYQPKKGTQVTCGKRSCAARAGHRRRPRTERPLLQCAHCFGWFRPTRKPTAEHPCCSPSCGNAYSVARSPRRRAALASGVARHQLEDARKVADLNERLKHLTPAEIYRLGHKNGRVALWTRLVKQGVIQPHDKRPWPQDVPRRSPRQAVQMHGSSEESSVKDGRQAWRA